MDKSKYAPRPNKKGITQAAYDTIETLGGGTFFDISKYMPAALLKEKKITRRQLQVALDNGQRRGYFVKDPKGYWRIAPIEYWTAREDYRKRQYGPKPNGAAPPVHVELAEPAELPNWVRWLILANGVAVTLLILGGIFGLGFWMGAGQ